MVVWVRIWGMCLLACFSITGIAGEGIPTPETLTGGTIILPTEAKTLLDNKEGHFFDVRNPINFGRGHVAGASVLPYSGKSKKIVDFDASLDKFDVTQLPTNKNAVIVIYSHGITGWKSYKAAVSAIRAGYKDVRWMRQGYGKWLKMKYPTNPYP